jgi:hypothetical protein
MARGQLWTSLNVAEGLLWVPFCLVLRRNGTSLQAVDDALKRLVSPSPLPKLHELPGLNVKESYPNCAGTAEPPLSWCHSRNHRGVYSPARGPLALLRRIGLGWEPPVPKHQLVEFK